MKNSSSKSKSNFLSAATKAASALAICFLVAGCSQTHSQSVQQASKDISDSLGCSNVQSKIFDAFYAMIDQHQVVPAADELKRELQDKLQELTLQSGNQLGTAAERKLLAALQKELDVLVDLMLAESKLNPGLPWKEQVQKIIEYEMEDQSDPVTAKSSKQISEKVKSIKKISENLGVACQSPDTTPPETSPETSPVTSPEELHATPGTTLPAPGVTKSTYMAKGLDRVFATAYQSCRVLDLPEMDRSTASVAGITRDGDHEDGIGGKRFITDLRAVQNTHYYIRGIASESSCREVRNNPLIYDYGGSPAVTSTSINFFTNAGTGTAALGVDCSAYISSGIAVAGLRYKPGLENKPIYIRQNSRKFIDAQASGFACFENVTVSKTASIKPGDIVGVIGHVLAVDKVGTDPFAIGLLKSASECATLDYKKFDIVVSQSSPSKNGIGINKYHLKDYLDETGKMRTAFTEMGKQACLAHFQNKNIKPKSSEWGFLRHKGSAECMAPRVTIAGESCTQKCF